MKLEEYAIKNALQREDWGAAVSALAAHFELCIPEGYRLDLLRHHGFEHEIEIAQGGTVYSWRAHRGFDSWPKWRKLYGTDFIVDIYAPMASPAGPKAGVPRS